MHNWNKLTAQEWCWQFLVRNKRVPTLQDLSSDNSNSDVPSEVFVIDQFHTLNELVESCGPQGGQTFKSLRLGFQRFYDENGHFPSANEIDLCGYLIKSRSIQRSWGGLPNLRNLMGMDITDYGRGATRATIAERIGKRGFSGESDFEKILVTKFGEIFVHTQKRIDNINVDFFIYSPDQTFGIDVFYYETDHDLKGIINIKQKTYEHFPYTVVFIPMNNKKNQKELDEILSKKDKSLPIHCKLFSIDYFTEWINGFGRYPDPRNMGKS